MIFRSIFYLKKRKKSDLLTCRLTWRAEADVARAEADVVRGTNLGCDVALRARGSARVARAGGALGAPSGRVTHGRPCGAPRTGSVIEGIEIINRGIHSPIYTQYFPLFSPCGTMFPLQVTWTRGERPISSRTATITWTRVHAIIKSTTCAKRRLK